MLDNITLDRIQLLHPAVIDEVEYAYLNRIVPSLPNVTCRFAYTLRTFSEQDYLYSKGRTLLFDKNGNRLGKVTNAKGGQSFHNYGLAIDIVLLDGKKASWNTVRDYDGDGLADWMEVVKIFKTLGWEWGGDWKSKDKPHFQKTFGYTWKQLLSLYNKDKFLPNSKYLILN